MLTYVMTVSYCWQTVRKIHKRLFEFVHVHERVKLKVNAMKSKVMIFQRMEYDGLGFRKRIRVEKVCKKDIILS